MHPHAVPGADLGHGVQRVHRAGQGRSPRGDDGDRGHAVGAVGGDGLLQGVRPQAPAIVEGQLADRVTSQADHLDRAHDGLMRLLRAVDGPSAAPDPSHPAARQGPLAGSQQRGEVGHHAAAGEHALAERVADELSHPPHRLALEEVDGPARGGRVDVVGRGQRRAENPGLQAGRADVGDVQRPRWGDAGVKRAGGVLKRGLDVPRLAG